MLRWEIRQGDVMERLAEMPDESVHCVITSPPYWGLRDYGIAGQMGLEPTPEEYVEKMVGVFREVGRVLRQDGTLWLNMGDCYASAPCGNPQNCETSGLTSPGLGTDLVVRGQKKNTVVDGLKPKDLVGMPWRLAFALQADGWWLRSDIIWSKPNPMPESVSDRPTKAHEYVFLLTRRARYYYDVEAIKEEATYGYREWTGEVRSVAQDGRRRTTGRTKGGEPSGGRNRRSVWEIATQPFAEAHFATFPEKLVEPCVLAGTSAKGCCAKCGAGWERITKAGEEIGWRPQCGCYGRWYERQWPRERWEESGRKWLYWRSGKHPPLDQCMVMDPFVGSGTVGVVALRHGRNFVGIELNPEYCEMARKRIAGSAPMWAEEISRKDAKARRGTVK